jgi:hypothetical protein
MKVEIAHTEGIELETNSSPKLKNSLASLKKNKKKKNIKAE